MLPRNDQGCPSQFNTEVYALSAVAEKSAASRTDAVNPDVMMQNANGHVSMLERALDGMYDPERVLTNMAPPKRFHRTFWKSLSLRLLDQCAQSVWKSLKPVPGRV
jgi:hypothetical protein